MKVQVVVVHREKNKELVRELIFNPTDGDWPENLWPQLAYKVFLAYGDEKLGDYCQAVTISSYNNPRNSKTFGKYQLQNMYK